MERYITTLSQNLFSPSDFDLQSLHQEKNRKKLASNQDEDDTAARIEDADSQASGVVDTFHPLFGSKGEDCYKDLCILKGDKYGGFVFSGVPYRLRSPLFEITAMGEVQRGKKIRNQWKVFKCARVDWKPRPFTTEVLETMIDILQINHDDSYIMIGNGPVGQTPDGELIYDAQAFYDAVSSYESKVSRDLLKGSEQIKMYFRSDVFQLLCPDYYSEDVIACLSLDTMDCLVTNIQSVPHLLCFTKLIHHKHEPPSGYKNLSGSFIRSVDGLLKIPELSFDQLLAALEQFENNETEEKHFVACMIYDRLKTDMNLEKHMYVDSRDLQKTYAHYKEGKDTVQNFELATAWLKEKDIIFVDESQRYYLSQAFRWELSIATAFEYLCVKQAMIKPPIPEVDLTQLRSHQGHALVDEQIRAFQRFQCYPLLLVDGQGGSGKTDFLGCVSKHSDLKTVIATSHNSINAGHLNKIFPKRAFTTHQLLYFHRMTCLRDENPLKSQAEAQASEVQQKQILKSIKFTIDMDDDDVPSPDAATKQKETKKEKKGKAEEKKLPKKHATKLGLMYEKCIFENIEIAVVDELSTMEPSIFAEFLSALICCGKLRKLLMCGDRGQLPAIQRGNVIKKVYEALNKIGMTIDFECNHRVRKGADLLRILGDSIRNVTPSTIKFDMTTVINIPLEVKYNTSNSEKFSIIRSYVRDLLASFKLGEYTHHFVTRTREYRSKITAVVEEYYHQQDPNLQGLVYNQRCYWVGRKIFFSQNNHEFRISNNEIFVLRSVRDRNKHNGTEKLHKYTSARVDGKEWTRYILISPVDDPERIIELEWEDWARHWISRGSCNTVASFQGSQVPDAIFVLPYPSRYDTNENTYTACSRGQNRMFIMGSLKNFERAIRNPEPLRRSSLAEMINDCCERFKDTFDGPDESYANELERKRKKLPLTTTKTTTTITHQTKTIIKKEEIIKQEEPLKLKPVEIVIPKKEEEVTPPAESKKETKRKIKEDDEDEKKRKAKKRRKEEKLKRKEEKIKRKEEKRLKRKREKKEKMREEKKRIKEEKRLEEKKRKEEKKRLAKIRRKEEKKMKKKEERRKKREMERLKAKKKVLEPEMRLASCMTVKF